MNIREVPDIQQCVEIGTISRPHGKDGEVLVSAKNIDYEDFQDLKYVFFRLQERLVPFFIESVMLSAYIITRPSAFLAAPVPSARCNY